MVFRRFRKKRPARGRYKRKYSRSSAASAIQKAFRRRRNKAKVFRSMKNYAVQKANRSPAEMVYKSFTIICPDQQLVQPHTAGPNGSRGLNCVSTTGDNTYKSCFEIGMFLRDANATNLLVPFSPEMVNYFDLFRQARIVHGSVSMLRYSDSMGDGQPSTGTPPTSSIGTTGQKQWCNYVQSVIDNGSFRNVNDLVKLTNASPATNIASISEDEYLANSNSRLTQMAWNNYKSFKQKIINPDKRSEWANQTFGIFNNATPPVAQYQLRTNAPWLDTNVLKNVASNGYASLNPNYQSVYALTRLPPLSVFGTAWPVNVETIAGVPQPSNTPIHKVLLSLCVAFRIPTTRT